MLGNDGWYKHSVKKTNRKKKWNVKRKEKLYGLSTVSLSHRPLFAYQLELVMSFGNMETINFRCG